MPYNIYKVQSKKEAEAAPQLLFTSEKSNHLYDAVQDAIANGIELNDANLDGLHLHGDLVGLSAQSASMQGFMSRGYAIKDSNFRGAKISGDFSGSSVERCDFAIATLSGDMTLSNIDDCLFWGCMLANLDMTASAQKKLQFSGAYTNASESLKGLLPQTAPLEHRKMMQFDSDVSLRGRPHGAGYYNRLLMLIQLDAPKYGQVESCVDVEFATNTASVSGLTDEQLLGVPMQISSSPKVAEIICQKCGVAKASELTLNTLLAAGATFRTNNEKLQSKLQGFSVAQQENKYQAAASGVQFLEPLLNTRTLSAQLQQITGDAFGAISYKNAYGTEDRQVIPAGLIEHAKSGQQFYVPQPAVYGQNPGWELARLSALARTGGAGGFSWGNTSGSDGGHGKELLSSLIDADLVRRTGGETPNGLGGVWPEVALTKAGHIVAQAFEQQKPQLEWVGQPKAEVRERREPSLRPQM